MRTLAALGALLLVSAAPQDGTSRLLDVLVARHAREGDPADVRSAAARLGFDRAKIAAFVRESIAFEPYAGVLRDAPGTLLARRGTALDRALLLAAMLEAGGEKIRLMRGDLERPAEQGPVDLRLPPADLKALAAELGADEAVVRAVVEEARREEDALVAEVVEAGRARGPALLALAGGAPAAEPPLLETSWVQVYGAKGWEDVDAPAAAKPRPWAPAELAAQRRSLVIRLVLRRKSGDKIEPVQILRVPLDAAAVAWKAIELDVTPEERQLPKAEKLLEMTPAERLDALKKVKIYRPGLVVDGKVYGGQPFDVDGKVYEVSPTGVTAPARELARGLGGAFGGLVGGGDEKPASALAGLDLEIVQKEPGAPERVHHRALLSPAQGSRALPILQVSLLVDGAPLRPGDRGRREVAAYARNARAFRALLAGDLKGPRISPNVEVNSLLLRFVDLRRRALVELAGGKPFVQDSLGLTAASRQLFLDEAAGAVFERRGIDLLDNPLWIPGDPAATASLGAADTALEALLLSRRHPGSTSGSAWTILERERLLNGAPASKADGPRLKVSWSDAAWWSVEPGRGRVVGRGASGAGQGMVEYAIDQASKICSYTDMAGVLTMHPGTPQGVRDANDMYGDACSVLGGTTARDKMMGKIKDMNADLWAGATQALGGM
ncbi:MAG TPA: hypothetical protein VF950_24585 [Planctomycetota bacterium]